MSFATCHVLCSCVAQIECCATTRKKLDYLRNLFLFERKGKRKKSRTRIHIRTRQRIELERVSLSKASIWLIAHSLWRKASQLMEPANILAQQPLGRRFLLCAGVKIGSQLNENPAKNLQFMMLVELIREEL